MPSRQTKNIRGHQVPQKLLSCVNWNRKESGGKKSRIAAIMIQFLRDKTGRRVVKILLVSVMSSTGMVFISLSFENNRNIQNGIACLQIRKG